MDPTSLHSKVSEAIDKVRTGLLDPYKPALSMTVTVRMKTAELVEAATQKLQAQRIDEYTVEGKVERLQDMDEVMNILRFL